jgi:hypothetical protein
MAIGGRGGGEAGKRVPDVFLVVCLALLDYAHLCRLPLVGVWLYGILFLHDCQ